MKNLNRKISSVSLALLFVAGITACKDASFNTNVKVKGDAIYYNVIPTTETEVEMAAPTKVNLNKWAVDNNFDMSKINSIKITQVDFYMIDTTTAPYTFDILDAIDGTVKGSNQEVEVISDSEIEKDGRAMINLDVNDIDIKGLLNDTNVAVQFNASVNTPITHPFVLKAEMHYTINAEITE